MPIKQESPINYIKKRAIRISAIYIEQNINKAMLFDSKEQLWDYAISKIKFNGLLVEFGVISGYSINYFSKKIPYKKIYGFDSFEGLREDWIGTYLVKGSFNLKGFLPHVNSNVILIKGWFDESLPKFLRENNEHFSIIHFDADTYESTKILLELIGDRIVKDTIIIFDVYIGIPNWQNGEYLAWKEFVESKSIKYQYIGFSIEQAVLQIN
jgi:hypothetical protein